MAHRPRSKSLPARINRSCSRSSPRTRSSASTRPPWKSRSTSRSRRRPRRSWSAWPRRRCGRARTGSSGRSSIRDIRRPIDRVVINLAPADLKKDAGGFDLPIALGLLLGSGQVAIDRPGSFAIVGELALTGETRPIKGVLAMALQAAAERRDGLLVPAANAPEAAVVEGLNVIPIGSLAEAVGFLSGQLDIVPQSRRPRRGLPPALAHRGGLRRRQGPGLRQAGPADRRGRLAQHPDDRARPARARRCWPSGCRRSCRR